MNRLLRISLAVVTIGASAVVLRFNPVHARAADTGVERRPVLVELFTSEGCSSCPPADSLLARLDAGQGIPGAQAIVLSEHVTYWDRLGWRDRFSLDSVTGRQEQYAIRFHLDSVYTPQMVVDGARQFTGSDAHALVDAVKQSAAQPKLALSIASAQWSGGVLRFQLTGDPAPRTDLIAALADDSDRTVVKSGENGGRTLEHVAVVRVLMQIGDGGKTYQGKTFELAPAPGQTADSARLVVFLEDTRDGRVVGVAEQKAQR